MFKEEKIILQDLSARNKIFSDFEHNFLVEASAGSGKTSCLVKRMVALVKSGRYTVAQIAAITFTRKAALELKERFQQEIESEYRHTNIAKEKELLFSALDNMGQCYIGTIHSFCARILRERPIEAGLDPDFKEMDDIDNAIFMEQAWEEYLANLRIQEHDHFQNLRALGIQISDLEEIYKLVSQFPEVMIVQQKIDKPPLDKAMDELLLFCKEAIEYIPEIPPEKGFDSVQQIVLQTERLKMSPLYAQNYPFRISLLEQFSKNSQKTGAVTLKCWRSKDKAKEYRDTILPKLNKEHIEPTLTRWREYCHNPIFCFVKPAVDYYHRFRARHSLLNFQDLLLNTAALLRDNFEVRRYFQQKYRTILVDEFQDTDPIQAEIIFFLTGEQLAERDWKKLSPRNGSLFVVGDPQQAIYHFRRADIAVYNQVKMLIAENKGQVLRLNANFRSLHSLGRFINPLFQDLFPGQEDELQVNYTPMQTTRDDRKGFISGVYQILISPGKEREVTIKNDAQAIALLIRDWINSKVKIVRTEEELAQGISSAVEYQDFMILLRYKKDMDIYAKVLSEYSIPVTVSGSTALNKSLYLRELLKLLRLLKDPENQILLVAVLRGIFFGFSDQELYEYKEAGGNFTLFADIPDDLENGLGQKFEDFFRQIREYYFWSSEYSPVTALEKIMIKTGLLPYLSGGITENESGSELFFVLEYLRKLEMRDYFSYAGMVEQLERLWESGAEEEFKMGVTENAVRIMNLHKAKGLESPIVFLAMSYSISKPKPKYYIERFGDIPEGHFTVQRYNYFGNGPIIAQPPDWEKYSRLESSYLEAEETRLLYVAVTRAKNMLVISSLGAGQNDNRQNVWGPLLKKLAPEAVLEIPAGNNMPLGIIKKSYNLKEYKTEMAKLEQRRKKLSANTYLETSASRLTEFFEIKPSFIPTIDRGGRDWGNAVHEILDYFIKKPEEGDLLEKYIIFVLKKNSIELSRKDELQGIIQKFRQSDLYKRLERALERYTEVPFNLKIVPDDPLYPELIGGEAKQHKKEKKPLILTGTVDLIFQEADGWVIVDYKTDCPLNVKDYAKLRKLYQPQIKTYAAIWQRVSKERVKESHIYFIEE